MVLVIFSDGQVMAKDLNTKFALLHMADMCERTGRQLRKQAEKVETEKGKNELVEIPPIGNDETN